MVQEQSEQFPGWLSALWPVITALAGFIVADIRAGARTETQAAELARRMNEVENAQRQQSLTNLAVAGALGRLESIDNRLERIEDRLHTFPGRDSK